MILLLLLGALQASEELCVQSEPVSRREGKTLIEGLTASSAEAELVRAFVRGEGWEYRVRVSPLPSAEEAQEILGSLPGSRLYVCAGRDVIPFEGEGGLESSTPATGLQLLEETTRAHGVPLSPDQPYHFSFERRIERKGQELRVWHDVYQAGGARRLEVRMVSGEGIDSVLLISNEQASLIVDGTQQQVELGPAKEIFEAFTPARVLERARWIPGAAEGAEQVTSEEGSILLVTEDSEQIRMDVDPADHRVRQLAVSVGSDEVSWSYDDYREVGAWLVPFEVEVRQGRQRWESISVLAFSTADIDEAVFTPSLH